MTSSTCGASSGSALPSEHFRQSTLASPWRQMLALAGSEWRLLLRNKVALINTIAAPGLLVFMFASLPASRELGLARMAPVVLLGMVLTFVVYYTLVTSLVARRESYVLQRLRTGEASDVTILAGLALPFALIAAAQTLLSVLGVGVFLGVGIPANVGLIAVAIVLGTFVWAMLGIASTGMTRSVEHAQITTMPLILVAILFSGMSFPLTFLPEALQILASLTPMHPALDLMRLGMVGVDAHGAQLDLVGTFAAAVKPLLILLGWVVLSGWAARRYLRWQPRR
ncbi:daunorubicin resistance ABC transporter membrane protein [Dermatophilus congolensis]|uniref:Daunorubicin resistance ABC transporter membrane protein n=1 Tax=Dermatophilus congolensis TaxID=1863 RepID=A0AA46BPK9_9MICO|nr:ABC transporter permease [Dermatophilus congolensis]STD13440.1 daunorubicin resistance ABC transporter membrane protein [Dermatophilus congolensis]